MLDLKQSEVLYQDGDDVVLQEWLHGERMVIFRAKGTYTREVVDAWGKAVLATVQAWPAERTYYAIHDNSQVKNAFTPIARMWIEKITQASKHLVGYYAVVLDNGITSRVFKMLVEGQLRRQLPNLQSKVFHNSDEALRWLETHFK